jgi:hypothetical protein
MAPVTSHRGRRCPLSRLGVFHGLRHGRRALTVRATMVATSCELRPGWEPRKEQVDDTWRKVALLCLESAAFSQSWPSWVPQALLSTTKLGP